MKALQPLEPAGPPRIAACRDWSRLCRFLDSEFDGTPGIAAEFPLLVAERALERCLVVEGSHGPVAHAAWRPLELVTDRGTLRAAGLGNDTPLAGYHGGLTEEELRIPLLVWSNGA